jgi:dipeptidase D
MFDGYEYYGMQIAAINGGSLRNAIPRESVATVCVTKELEDSFIGAGNLDITTILMGIIC